MGVRGGGGEGGLDNKNYPTNHLSTVDMRTQLPSL